MTRALWLNLRAERVLWGTPALACALLVLAAPQISVARPTSLAVSSAAAYAIYLWAPVQLYVGYVVLRRAALCRDDPLPWAHSTAGRLRRVLSALLLPAGWGCAGWLAYWAGCDVIGRRGDTGLLWTMSFNGCALSVLATSLGAVLAVRAAPSWVAALVAGCLWFGLVIWTYLPPTPASVLLEAYHPQFLATALPNPWRVALPVVWSASLLLAAVVWISRAARGPLVALAVAGLAGTLVVVAARTPVVLPRAGHLAMTCRSHHGTQVCLWADHESARERFGRGVDLARKLVGARVVLPAVREGDIERPPDRTLPRPARAAVVTTSSARPAPAAVAATLVAGTLRPPQRCAEVVPAGAVRAVLEIAIAQHASPATGATLSDVDLSRWIVRTRETVARCEQPVDP